MHWDGAFLGLMVFVFLASTTEALAGFGGVVIALTLGALLYPIKALLPLLVVLNLGVTAYIVWRHGRHADKNLLLRQIVPGMLVGGAVGLALFRFAHGPLLKHAYGAFIFLFAARELYRARVLARSGAGSPATGGPTGWKGGIWILLAGVVHGIYASGGPLLVYAVGRRGLEKTTFRSTLCVLWFASSIALAGAYAATGTLKTAQLPFIAALIPIVILAVIVGEWAHRRIDEARFRLAIYTVLMFAGGSIALV